MTPSPERSPILKPSISCSRLRPSASRSSLLGRDRSCGRTQRRGHSQGRKPQGWPPAAPRASLAPEPEARLEVDIVAELPTPEPLNISDTALDAADENLFHVTPSSSPASTKVDLDGELDDLFPFLESKEAFSPMRQPDFSVDVDICLSGLGDDLKINVNMNGVDLKLGEEDCGSFGRTLDLQMDDSDDSTCSIGEVEDVDVFGEDDDDVEEVEAMFEASSEAEQSQVVDEEADDFLQLRKEELTMSFATEYTNQVIESVLKSTNASGELSSERLKALSEPPQVHRKASTCATVEAEQAPPRVRLDAAAAGARQAAASPTRPASSRSLISSRSRRRIIGGVVRSPAPAEVADASFASAPPLSPKLGDFDPTSPKASGSSLLRSMPRSRAGTKDKSLTKKRSMTVFRMDMMDEASSSETPGRSSSLARGYDALGAEIYSLHDRSEPQCSDTSRISAGPEVDWTASSGHSAAFASTVGRAGLGRVQSASALALDLGLEQEPAHASSPDAASPWTSSAFSKGFVIRSSASTGSLAFPKAKKLQGTSLPSISKRQGLLPDLPASPSSAGSIAWSMRLAKAGARRGGLASVF